MPARTRGSVIRTSRSAWSPETAGVVAWPHLVGHARAKEYLMTGDLLTAAEAERIGLVNHVVPEDELDDRVYAMAERLAGGATKANPLDQGRRSTSVSNATRTASWTRASATRCSRSHPTITARRSTHSSTSEDPSSRATEPPARLRQRPRNRKVETGSRVSAKRTFVDMRGRLCSTRSFRPPRGPDHWERMR